jgi:hypothetical protein
MNVPRRALLWRLAVGSALSLALVTALWVGRRAPPGAAPLQPTVAAGARAAAAPMVWPASEALLLVAPPAPSTASLAGSGPKPDLAAIAPSRGEPAARSHWDLCGIGRLPVPPGASADAPPPHVMLEAAASLEPRWEAALATAGPRARAAARRMGLVELPAGEAAVTPAMAEASADPVISAWAMQGCGNDVACLQATARRWQQLEPDNLAPRLSVLRWTPRPDLATLQALATATRLQVHFGQLGPSLLAAWPAGEARFLQTELLVAAMVHEAASGLPSLMPLTRACREGAANADIRDACQRIARTMFQHSDTLFGVNVGLGLGRVSGLPPEELRGVQSLKGQAHHATEALTKHLADQPWSCTSNTTLVAWAGEVQQHGEWLAIQRRLAARAAPSR